MQNQVFITGYGHSGTRVISEILKHSGYHVGKNLNRVYDVRGLSSLLYRYEANPGLINDKAFMNGAEALIGANTQKTNPWALKEGVMMRALPLMHKLFPDAVFVLTVRHGMDQILRWPLWGGDEKAKNVLDSDEMEKSYFVKQMLFWGRLYRNAVRYLDENGIPEHTVKLENLCKYPGAEIRRLFLFLGVKRQNVRGLIKLVKTPPTIGGRFKKQRIKGNLYKPDMVEVLKRNDDRMLRYFGYEI